MTALFGRRLASAAFAAALLFTARLGVAEEKSLLAPDGTVYTVRSGSAADLGVTGPGVRPDDSLIEWTSLAQDGTRSIGVIPNTTSANPKRNLDLAYDELSSSLVLLWKEDLPVINVLHLGVFQKGAWKALDLLPNLGFAHAYNPQMLLSHQTVHWLDADGKDAWRARSILSIVWWEESQYAQARYAPVFLDEDTVSSDVQVYDLPSLVGGGGATSYGDAPVGAYMFPSVQLEGPSGAILASFADLSQNKHFVVRLIFPTDLGQTTPGSMTWMRRRIPVVGVAMRGEIAASAPLESTKGIFTIIGPTYKPTMIWTDDDAVRYIRLEDSGKWSAAKAIAIKDDMTPDRAFSLVREMATKN